MLFRSDRKSTRLNSSHLVISYAVFCLKKKNTKKTSIPFTPLRHGRTSLPCCDSFFVFCRFHLFFSSGTVCLLWVFVLFFFFFFNDTATPEIYPLSLHDALPICHPRHPLRVAWRHIARQTRTASYPFASPARQCRITRPAPFSRLIAPERTPSVRNVLARARPRSQSTARRSNSTTVAPGFVRKRLAN